MRDHLGAVHPQANNAPSESEYTESTIPLHNADYDDFTETTASRSDVDSIVYTTTRHPQQASYTASTLSTLSPRPTAASVGPPPAQPHVQGSPEMDAFFAGVSAIKRILEDIRNSGENLKEMQEDSKASTRMDESKELALAMRSVVVEVSKRASEAKKRLEEMDRLNSEAVQRPGNEVGSSNERMRSAVTQGLRKKLHALMAEFASLKQRIQEEHRESVSRQLYTVTGEAATDDEVDSVIETGQSESIFQKTAQEIGKGHILDTFAEIQERHEAVKVLEKSLIELHQVFMDMAVLVESQGDKLDNIEAQVGKSVEFVTKGTEQLVQARDLQKNSQKWMCYSIICCIILLAIVGAAVSPTLIETFG